jgi:hypothetical protein
MLRVPGRSALALTLWLAAVATVQPSLSVAAEACDLSAIGGARELHETLGRRAAEVVKRATAPEWASDVRLAQLVAANASIGLGAGDVGRPLGHGLAGVRALAETMQADTYTFAGWDYVDGPAKPCDVQKVTVEFTNSGGRRRATVEFQFEGGRVMAAKGWERSFETGAVR